MIVERLGVGFQKAVVILVCGLLLLPSVPLGAKTRKGDKLRNESRTEEQKGNLDHALELAEKALSEDSADPAYILLVRRLRFEAGSAHVKIGQKLRMEGKLEEALAEFERAYGIDAASAISIQEIRRTRDMIERNKNGGEAPIAFTAERKAMTPAELSRRDSQDRTDSLLPVAELRALNADPIDLKMTNRPRVLFETVCKVAGVNVLFDPEYNQQQTLQQAQVDLNRTTLDEALDQISIVTKSYWKPLSASTIFVTVDNPTKRREYADQVVKVFYLSNVTTPQEMQEILTVLRTVVDVQKVFNFTAQNALVVRAESDTMALVEKLISDLDKPRSEVIVDVIVMQVSSTYIRKLTAAFAPAGITTSAVFSPRGAAASTTTTTTGTPTTTTTPGTNLSLNRLGHISSGDYSLTNLPGAEFEAILTDSGTRVMQAPQIRAADNAKASIKIGDKVPTASGSFQPGVGGIGVGVNPLVNTQFTFIDVGVNLEINPKVHDNGEISLHIDLDVSQVKDRIDIGGVSQPIISQNKALADVRLRDGEVNIIGGIMQQTNSRAISGIPGLASIPGLGRLFSGESVQKDKTELMIALIPHIVRGPDITTSNLRGIAAGNATQIKVSYGPRRGGSSAAPPATAPATGTAPPTAPPSTAPIAAPGLPPATAPPDSAAPPPPDPGAARVSFLPGSSVTTQLSQSITVTIYAENVKDLVQASAKLQFDPRILRISNIVAADLPQRDGVQVQPARNILNDSGTAEVSFARAPGAPGVSGAGGLFSIILQAVGRGNTSITVPGLTLGAANGTPFAVGAPPPLVVNVQ